ncbi:MAG: helix-turn-helix domain-containing protein, partial [Candidatus Diapherotrites archaeon]|nr:helix-turn-helix domain-containing protein [Candidatus Diapherotrites archaeon]
MKEFNCDLHFHGPQSSGVSKNMEIPVIAKQSELKGLQVVSTSDILNQKWFEHVKKFLVEEENNVFTARDSKTNLIVGTEVNCNKRVHHLIYLPSLESAIELKNSMEGKAIFDSWGCGRPTIRLSAEEIAEHVKDAGGIIGPAHAFTPYFSVYAHFNSLKEVYGNQEKNIYFMELGLSADTNLADLISENHKYSFLTNSDSHCVHPESIIYRYNGEPIKIKDFDEKEVIQSFDFEKETVVNSTARKMKIKSPQELIEINCVSGHIKVTPEHRFFVLKKGKIIEKFASNLKKGEYIAIISKLNFSPNKINTPEIKLIKYFKINKEGLQKIKEKRKQKKFTQVQIERKLELKKDYYWRLEKGQYKINEITIKKILKILKINQKKFTEKYCNIEPNTKIPKKFNEKISELVGYVLGDGCFEKGRKGNQLGLTDKNNALLEYYSESFFKEFNEKRKVSEKDKTKNSYRLRLSSKILEFFNKISPKLLCKSNQRNVPSIVFDFNKKNTSAFIRGFFDAEGCVGNHYIDACSSNLHLLKGIQSLLLKFEINSSIYENLFEKTKKKYRHRLHVFGQENLKKYQRKINFNHKEKRKKLLKYLKKLIQKPKK